MRNCIVFGCGRSGTSAAAGAIIKANPHYYSGGDFVPPRISNPDGTYEPIAIRRINEDILTNVVPARPVEHDSTYFHIPTMWQRWLARIPLDATISASEELQDRIKEQVQRKPYCLKDPRFSYTLHAWRPFLQEVAFVCMFRHPAEAARSILRFVEEFELMKEFRISYEEAIEAWTCLNEHILEKHLSAGGSWLFLHLDQLYTNEGQQRFADFLGTTIDSQSIRRDRKRTVLNEAVPEKTKRLYDQLCRLAGFSG